MRFRKLVFPAGRSNQRSRIVIIVHSHSIVDATTVLPVVIVEESIIISVHTIVVSEDGIHVSIVGICLILLEDIPTNNRVSCVLIIRVSSILAISTILLEDLIVTITIEDTVLHCIGILLIGSTLEGVILALCKNIVTLIHRRDDFKCDKSKVQLQQLTKVRKQFKRKCLVLM